MKEKQKTYYECDICKYTYSTKEEALRCESRPVSQDKGAQVGDKVRILNGEGMGRLAIVTKVSIIDKDWGHYAWKRYWHTVMVVVDVIDSWGSRVLTFDDYEVVR